MGLAPRASYGRHAGVKNPESGRNLGQCASNHLRLADLRKITNDHRLMQRQRRVSGIDHNAELAGFEQAGRHRDDLAARPSQGLAMLADVEWLFSL